MIKTRTFSDSNYKAIYCNGKTLRIPLNPKKQITELKFPEFYDVKITSKCNGNCSYCYQDSKQNDDHFKNIPEKIHNFFGKMSENERPFQVAIGGGEPTLHPEFGEICKAFKELDIDPNYTTNGTNLTSKVLDATVSYVNGVAVSCHRHLPWRNALNTLLDLDIYTNLHIMISNDNSVEEFYSIYKNTDERIKYFVLLPVISHGRSNIGFTAWSKLEKVLEEIGDISKIAFGANLYPYIQNKGNCWDISLYEPEIMSKYLVMDDEMKLYPSSFYREEND